METLNFATRETTDSRLAVGTSPQSAFYSRFKKTLLSFCLGVIGVAAAAAENPTVLPWETSALNLETGLLWQIGTGTPLSYRLVPTQLSWRSPKAFGWELANGSQILVCHRLTLLGTWIQQGPESHYIAVMGSPSVEWWDKDSKWCFFGGSGGGAGLLDSRGVKGGQGQDFTLTWFIRGGIERVFAPGRTLNAGILYQHMSNGGQTKPNPGIDALGFTLGYTWKY